MARRAVIGKRRESAGEKKGLYRIQMEYRIMEAGERAPVQPGTGPDCDGCKDRKRNGPENGSARSAGNMGCGLLYTGGYNERQSI